MDAIKRHAAFWRALYYNVENYSVAKRFTLFMSLIVFCPLAVLMILIKGFGLRETTSGIVAVIMVNVLVAMYVITAIREPDSDAQRTEGGLVISPNRPSPTAACKIAIGKE